MTDAERYQFIRSKKTLIRAIALALGYGYSKDIYSPMHGGDYLDEIIEECDEADVDAWGKQID